VLADCEVLRPKKVNIMKSHNDAYSVNVLVNGKPVTEVKHQGDTFIEGRSNSVFELKFQNYTGQRVLVIPSVDGLNTIDGEECGDKSKGYIVGRYGSLTIPGWTVDNKKAAKFQFKKQGGYNNNKTYTEAMDKSTENQGLIGFLVFKEKNVSYGGVILRGGVWDSPSYYDNINSQPSSWSYSTDTYTTTSIMGSATNEPLDIETQCSGISANFASSVSEPSLGTGFGKSTTFETTTVSFNQEDNTDAVFVYHYDTRKNLERQGVPVHLFNEHHAKKRPTPFPKSPEFGNGCKTPQGWRG